MVYRSVSRSELVKASIGVAQPRLSPPAQQEAMVAL